VIASDDKWFRDLAISRIIVGTTNQRRPQTSPASAGNIERMSMNDQQGAINRND
jgi:hypothetical protein